MNFKPFSQEVSMCYIEQNKGITDEEMVYNLEKDYVILESIVFKLSWEEFKNWEDFLC